MSLFDDPLGASRFRALFFNYDPDDPDAPDCLVTASETHYLCVWFGLVRGRWETIGLDLAPRLPSVVASGEDAELGHLMGWLGSMEASYGQALASGEALPITQADVRSAPLREAARWRASLLLDDATSTAPHLEWIDPAKLTDHQRRLAEALEDAHGYAHARRWGVSAAELIAKRRNLSRGRADQRIMQARLLGLIPPADDEAEPRLTEAAVKLQRELAKACGIRVLHNKEHDQEARRG